MNERQKIIRDVARILMETVLDLIQKDSHQWSTRPCSTCRAITNIVGRPFGCYKYAEDRAKEDKHD